MEVDWDAAKDAANRRKHGISLAAARRLDWFAGMPGKDEQHDYREERRYIFAPLDGRLHVCIHTLRAGRRRIISLRKANLRERRRYAVFIATTGG